MSENTNPVPVTTEQQLRLFGNDLIDLFRREGHHGGLWYGDRLLQAADELEAHARHRLAQSTPEPAGAQEAIETLRELKRRTPDYAGEGPKPQHYQRIHRAYDAAIAALAALPQPPADEVK